MRQLIFIFSEKRIKAEVLVIFKKSLEIYLKKIFFSKVKCCFFFFLNTDCICFLFRGYMYISLSELVGPDCAGCSGDAPVLRRQGRSHLTRCVRWLGLTGSVMCWSEVMLTSTRSPELMS